MIRGHPRYFAAQSRPHRGIPWLLHDRQRRDRELILGVVKPGTSRPRQHLGHREGAAAAAGPTRRFSLGVFRANRAAR